MRVVIVEDSAVLRAGLVRLLTDAGHTVSADVGDATDLTNVVAQADPQVVILDVRLPPTFTSEGIQAAIALRDRWPRLPILVFSQYVEERYAAQLIASSRSGLGYLLKDRVTDVEHFLESLHTVGTGGTVLDPEVVGQLLVRTHHRDALAALSPRELDVLRLMAQGRSNAAIARDLHISESSVEKHVTSLFGKLHLPVEEAGNRRVLAVLTYLGYPTAPGSY